MEFVILEKPNYAGKIRCKNINETIQFYTKKQMKTIYPNKNYRIAGEVGNNTGIQCGAAENLDGQPLPVYKVGTHNILTESVVGYTAVDNHTYLTVVKNTALKRLLILILFLALICAGKMIGGSCFH